MFIKTHTLFNKATSCFLLSNVIKSTFSLSILLRAVDLGCRLHFIGGSVRFSFKQKPCTEIKTTLHVLKAKSHVHLHLYVAFCPSTETENSLAFMSGC